MTAGGKAVALLDKLDAPGQIHREKLRQHGLDLGIADDGGFGVALQHQLQRGGVVGLHMVYHQIVEGSAAQLVRQIFEEHAINGLVHGVEEHRLLIQQQIGVIGNAVGDAVHTLKEGEATVVRTDPDQIVCDFSCAIHRLFSFMLFCGRGYSYYTCRSANAQEGKTRRQRIIEAVCARDFLQLLPACIKIEKTNGGE